MIKKKEILFVTPRVPAPGVFGDQLRSWNFLVHLAENFDVTLVCLDEKGRLDKHPHLTEKLVREVVLIPHPRWKCVAGALTGLLKGGAAQVGWYRSGSLDRVLKDLVASGRFSSAFVQTARLDGAVEALGSLPVILDFVDALSLQWQRRSQVGARPQRWFNSLEARRLAVTEKRQLDSCAVCLATGPDDARQIEEFSESCQRVHVVPNGVAMEKFQPLTTAVENTPQKVLFSGNLDYLPNSQAVKFFADEVMPILRQSVPDVRFVAAGKITDKELLKTGAELGVEFTGFVDDLSAEIAAADVVVAPMVSGAGIQNKVLEAMATGVPVVATRLANSAIAACHNREILIGAAPDTLAEHISALLTDETRRKVIGNAGRQFVQQGFSWQAQAAVVGGHLLDVTIDCKSTEPAPERELSWLKGPVPPWRLHLEEMVFGALGRFQNLSISVLLLVVFAALLPLLALLIKASSQGTVFYSQKRLGVDRRVGGRNSLSGPDRRKSDLGGKPFKIWKLRTMRSDAEVGTGPVWASENDRRVTRVGYWLRRSRLDEMPQLWNVMKGDMNLVGPRPERPFFAKELRQMFPGYSSRLRLIKPGLTGLAQVYGKYDTTFEKVDDKLLLDHGYRLNTNRARNRFVTDAKILLATIPTVLTGKGAH